MPGADRQREQTAQERQQTARPTPCRGPETCQTFCPTTVGVCGRAGARPALPARPASRAPERAGALTSMHACSVIQMLVCHGGKVSMTAVLVTSVAHLRHDTAMLRP